MKRGSLVTGCVYMLTCGGSIPPTRHENQATGQGCRSQIAEGLPINTVLAPWLSKPPTRGRA